MSQKYSFSTNPLLHHFQGSQPSYVSSATSNNYIPLSSNQNTDDGQEQQSKESNVSGAQQPYTDYYVPPAKFLNKQFTTGNTNKYQQSNNGQAGNENNFAKKVSFRSPKEQNSTEEDELRINNYSVSNGLKQSDISENLLQQNFQQSKIIKPTGGKILNESNEKGIADFRPKYKPTNTSSSFIRGNKKESNNEPVDQTVALIMNEYDRGMILYDKGEFDDALEHFQACLTAFSNSKIDDAEMCANIFLAMGLVYYSQGEEDSALELYNRCIQRLEDKFGKYYPGIVSPLVNIGLILTNRKKLDEALSTFQKAQKLAENILGDDRLCLADIYHNIGVIYDHQSRLDDAVDFYDKSIRIREKILGDSHPITALTYENLAQVLKDQKKCKKATEYQSKVITIRKKHFGINTYDYALALHNMGLILFKDRNLPQALPYFQKAYRQRSLLLGEDHDITKASKQFYDEIDKRLSEKKKRVTSLSSSINITLK
ncbi:hypothetical protein ABK040_010804 [Willaertia magna]